MAPSGLLLRSVTGYWCLTFKSTQIDLDLFLPLMKLNYHALLFKLNYFALLPLCPHLSDFLVGPQLHPLVKVVEKVTSAKLG